MPDFAWPWLLLLAPLPWLVGRSPVHGGAALRAPWVGELQAAVEPSMRPRLQRLPWLLALAWVALVVAAARPQALGEVEQAPRSGRDLMLAVDLSGSMSETDMRLGGRPVDRLTAVKAVVGDFLDRRQGDRVGLVLFGQRAYAVAPLTFDLDTVRQQLMDSVIGLAGRETAIGDAIALAVKRLREQPAEEGAQRVLILLTDGANNAGVVPPERAAQLAAAEGIRIHTIGFGGEPGAGLFGWRGGSREAEIDEQALEAISARTGGRYFRARATAELAGIYAELDQLEAVEHEGAPERPRLERYPWPLGLALLLLASALLAPALAGPVAAGSGTQERVRG